MTKKSAARLARDANIKECNTCWDDLNNIYDTCLVGINNAVVRLSDLYKDVSVRPFLENKKEIAILLRGVGKDKKELAARLETIHEKHMDKTGGMTKQDRESFDMLSLNLANDYNEWNTVMQTAFIPNIDYLIMQYGLAAEKMMAYVENAAKTQLAPAAEELLA